MSDGNGHTPDAATVTVPQIVRCDGAMLAEHWPFIRSKLLEVKRKTDHAQKKAGLTEAATMWLPEHIRIAIIKGLIGQNTCELYLVFEAGKVAGFFVTSCPPDEFLQVPLILHLWIAWSGSPRLLERCEPFLKELKRQRGCVVIQHTSGRQGWLRRNTPGWKLSQLVYRCEVD
jgi:hypothetical protein